MSDVKTCSNCKETMALDEYHKDSTQKDGFCLRCKKCTKEYRRDYYNKHRDKEISLARISTKNRRKNIKYLIHDYLEGCECFDCGEKNRNVLEFDHVRGEKEFNISNAKSHGYSDEKILDEIKKCDVRCCNCHRLVTYYRRVIERERCQS